MPRPCGMRDDREMFVGGKYCQTRVRKITKCDQSSWGGNLDRNIPTERVGMYKPTSVSWSTVD